jgi:hypothetical protein
MATAKGDNDNTHPTWRLRRTTARYSDWCNTRCFCLKRGGEIERLYGEKRNLKIKIQEAWFKYLAVKSKGKEMQTVFLTSLWPRKADDLSERWRGSNHQGCCEPHPIPRVILRKVLRDHLRTSDKKTYLQVFDVKHFPGKPLPLSFFAFRSEWGRSAKEEGFMDAGAPP